MKGNIQSFHKLLMITFFVLDIGQDLLETSEPDETFCCESKGVPSDCLGICKTKEHPVDYDNTDYPNLCENFKPEIDECWLRFYGLKFKGKDLKYLKYKYIVNLEQI